MLAVSYAIFGISEAAALVPEFAFLSCCWVGRPIVFHVIGWMPHLRWRSRCSSWGPPNVSYWGQQIMLDVPSYALLILAAGFLISNT